MATRMQQRRGTAAQWTAANPILAAGEIGFETDTSKFKMGNGSSTWSALQYFANAAELAAILGSGDIPALLNSIDELAAAMGDDPQFLATLNTNIGLKAPINNPTFTGTVGGVTKSMVGLGNADNTSDADKPVSTAAQTALDAKAPLASPALSGVPTAPTASTATNTTQIATTEFVQTKINNLVAGAPGLLDTLDELAAALGDDENFAADIANALALKASLANLSDHNGTTENVHGIGDTSLLVTTENLEDSITAAINTHTADQTSVHGIADTALLALKSEVTAAGTAASTALGLHADATESVHGIADTSLLVTQAQLEDALDTATVDQSQLAGVGIDWNTGSSQFDIDSTVATKTYADQAETDAIAAATAAAATEADSKIATAVGALTKSSVGLANVDNTSDANKPVSTATQTALDLKAPLADPTFTGTVSGVTKAHVGLGNADNTSDANKPVSTATQTALDAKASLAGATFTGSVEIDQNLVVDGNLTVNGTAFNASSTSIVIEDNMVQLAHQNAANTVDLGLVVGYNDGANKHSGIVRDVSADKWKLFKGVTTEPSTTVDFTQGSLDALQVAGFEATSIAATSATIGDVSNTELQYLNGVTSAVQTQIDAKSPINAPTFTGLVTVAASGVAFTDGTQTKEGTPSRTYIYGATNSNGKSANYTLSLLAERDSLIEVSHTGGTAVKVIIPTDATLNFPIGTSIDILQTNTGGVTIEAANSGTTAVNATPGLTLRTQWSSATLFKRGANSWVVYGDLK
jgi:hypothetical protein